MEEGVEGKGRKKRARSENVFRCEGLIVRSVGLGCGGLDGERGGVWIERGEGGGCLYTEIII